MPNINSRCNPPSTPISRSKSAALSRVLDSIPKGYSYYCKGSIRADKLASFLSKFHRQFGIGCSPAQRLTRKKNGLANCLLVVYQPENTGIAEWLLLATPGSGLETENLADVSNKPRLVWLGYELVRYASRGKVNWTWKRPKLQMTDWYNLLATLLNRQNAKQLQEVLQQIAHQPGFHGVREQSKQLFEFVRGKGFNEALPTLFYLQKIPHGEKVSIVH
jgi:hypothetical protein